MYLYVNNYRGFKNTYIPIKDINFFLGENSTGKTSILKLIKLLSGGQFWLMPDLASTDLNFHLFSDLCSDNNGRQKSIHVGLFDEGKKEPAAILLTFSGKNNITILKSFRYISKNSLTDIEVEFGEKNKLKVRYAFLPTGYAVDINWFKHNNLTNKNFEEIANEGALMRIGNSDTKMSQSIILTLSKAMHYVGNKPDAPSELAKKGIQFPSLNFREMIWSAPIRSEPKRTYDNYLPSFKSDGSHVPYVLRDLLLRNKKDNKKFLEYLNSFGRASGLFDELKIKEYTQENTAPFEVDIVLNGMSINLINVGYGVSQVLPILVEILTRNKELAFSLQQPEVHLHPKGQAALGEFFYNSWILEKQHFFIETHSDYLIDRFRVSMNKNKKAHKKQDGKCQVLFFNRTSTGNEVTAIDIEADGKYADDKPAEFRDFFVKEELDILSLY